MEIYQNFEDRLAGVDEKVATDGLRCLSSEKAVVGRVVELFLKLFLKHLKLHSLKQALFGQNMSLFSILVRI
jgi:hypothetical protein